MVSTYVKTKTNNVKIGLWCCWDVSLCIISLRLWGLWSRKNKTERLQKEKKEKCFMKQFNNNTNLSQQDLSGHLSWIRLNCIKLWLNTSSQILTQWIHAAVFPATTEKHTWIWPRVKHTHCESETPRRKERGGENKKIKRLKRRYINNTGQNKGLKLESWQQS